MDGTSLPAFHTTLLPRLFDRLQDPACAPALIFRDRRITATQLLARAQRIHQALLQLEIRTGDCVGVCMQRAPETLAALLAIWLCGAVYVPLDPQAPRERLRQQVSDAGLRLLLTQPELETAMAQLPVSLLPVLPLTDAAAETAMPVKPALPPLTQDSAAYLMFTSGSSGQPKGVLLSHGNLATFFAAVADLWLLAGDRTYLAAAGFTFDISLFELLAPLLFGGTLVLADHAQHKDAEALLQLIASHAIDVVQATPSLWQLLGNCAWPTNCSIGLGISIGEPLPKSLAARLLTRCASLWNLYGPTECTIWATAHRVSQADIAATAPVIVSLGQALPHYTAWLDHGELLLGGGAVALGYLPTPATITQRFRSDADGNRSYRTGDLAHCDESGHWHFGGRNDAQVKLNGHRVELEEIEQSLQQHYSVAQAACVVKHTQADGGGAQLLAFVVCKPGMPNRNAQRFNHWLADTLPAWMLPHRYLIVDALPLTANGKLDRQRLLQMAAETQQSTTPMLDPLASEVASVFCQILEIPAIGANDSFFDLGGTSMLTATLVLSLNQRFATNLSLRQVLQTPPTVQQLTRLLEQAGASPAS
ncbi:MAG TPA: non-ribosomal peptide synthetase [Candidatus Acidoferrum sp.]|nr:non-ribosomal peptide synthetase [Candidatus Acidoferrum sp.]